MHIAQLMATHALQCVLQGHNLTRGLKEANSLFSQASPQQRGAASDYVHNACRYLAKSEMILNALLTKPLTDRRIQALLLVAITQLNQGREESFTVVNQAVMAAGLFTRPKSQPWMKGLVNAVLRNYLRQQAIFDKPSTSLSVQFNYPDWWIESLQTQYPTAWQTMLEAGNQHPPMTLRVNQRFITRDDYLQRLHSEGIEAHALGEQAVVLAQAAAVQQLPGFLAGWVSVQDWGAQLAARILDVRDGHRVLDACAAPGGKTGHILELAAVELTALDSDAERLDKVKSNLTRLHQTAKLCAGDAATQAWWDGLPYDRILADVPCSASGVVRRHVDIKWLRKSDDIDLFATQQAKILRNLWKMLAKGGKLLYATCSVFQQENALQLEAFLSSTPDARRIPLPALAGNEWIESEDGQLRPCLHHDGFYYALLEKY